MADRRHPEEVRETAPVASALFPGGRQDSKFEKDNRPPPQSRPESGQRHPEEKKTQRKPANAKLPPESGKKIPKAKFCPRGEKKQQQKKAPSARFYRLQSRRVTSVQSETVAVCPRPRPHLHTPPPHVESCIVPKLNLTNAL